MVVVTSSGGQVVLQYVHAHISRQQLHAYMIVVRDPVYVVCVTMANMCFVLTERRGEPQGSCAQGEPAEAREGEALTPWPHCQLLRTRQLD